VHDDGITSISLTSRQPMDRQRISAWLSELIAGQGQDILRAKGIIDVDGEPRKLVFQAVHSLLEGDLQNAWKASEPRRSRLVFIGRHLDESALAAAFNACVAALPASAASLNAMPQPQALTS
jgi:G3E family GTPase